MKLLIVIVVVFFVGAPHAIAASGSFKAGFAQRDITPTEPVLLWGYGRDNRAESMVSIGTHDPLFAKAIVIEAGTERVAIVGMDLGRGPTEAMLNGIKAAVKEQCGVDQVLISGSHTHHAPVIELKDVEGRGKGTCDSTVAYVGFLQTQLIDAIVEAAGALEDARIGWAVGQTKVNRNRHSSIEPIPVDPELLVIRLDRADGRPIAHLVNFAGHPTNHPPQWLGISADFPGVMAREVEAALDTHCIFLQGAAGDLQCEIDDSLWGKKDFIEEVGIALAKEVLALAPRIETSVPEAPSISSSSHVFSFATRVDFKNPQFTDAFTQWFFPEIVTSFMDEVGDNLIEPRLTTVLLNKNLFLVGASGEFFCNHAIRLRERIRGAQVLFQGYCNGHHMYFPTIEGAAEGGYGADAQVNWAEVGAGEAMMDRAVGDYYRLRGDLPE